MTKRAPSPPADCRQPGAPARPHRRPRRPSDTVAPPVSLGQLLGVAVASHHGGGEGEDDLGYPEDLAGGVVGGLGGGGDDGVGQVLRAVDDDLVVLEEDEFRPAGYNIVGPALLLWQRFLVNDVVVLGWGTVRGWGTALGWGTGLGAGDRLVGGDLG